jgi:Holliday junction resolvasome RuvABC endonuclease subunit
LTRLIAHYQPYALVLQDVLAKNTRRSARIMELILQIARLAETRNIKVRCFSNEQVRRRFFGDSQGTKHALAEVLAKRFHEELGSCLPPKRRSWMGEDRRMDIFDAVALALAFQLKTTKLIV